MQVFLITFFAKKVMPDRRGQKMTDKSVFVNIRCLKQR